MIRELQEDSEVVEGRRFREPSEECLGKESKKFWVPACRLV